MSKRILMLCAALAAIASMLVAAEISGPAKIAPYKLIDHRIAGEWESAIWEIEPSAAVDLRTAENGKAITWVAPPGEYVLRVVLVNFSAKRLAQDRLAVTVGTAPEPPPNPQPGPGPAPKPAPGPLWTVIIRESAGQTPDQAAVILSPRVRALAEAQWGPRWAVLDPSPAARPAQAGFARLLERAAREKRPLPWVYFVGDAGEICDEGPLPAGETQMLEWMARLKGGTAPPIQPARQRWEAIE